MVAGSPVKITRTRMFLRILFKSLKVRRNRVAITFCSVAIGASIITALASVYFDISAKMSRELRTYGANFFIGPKAASGNRSIEAQVVESAIGMIPPQRLIGASPYLYGLVRLDLGNAVMAGVDFPGLRKLSPYWQVEGEWISVAFDEDSCMVGKHLAKTMELKVGDSVNVIRPETGIQKRLVVKGIAETGQAEDEQIFVNLSLAKRILGEPGVNHVMLSVVTQGTDIDGIARGMEERFPELDAKPIRKVSYSEGRILDKIKGLMAIVAVVILSVTTLCVMTTLIAVVSERTREIGLMKAIGADDRGIVLQFLCEIMIIGVAGVVAGLGLGFLLAQVLGQAVFGSAISFRAVVLPVTLVPSLLMALGIVPAKVLKDE
jgi:putative ABC transport system permease protein